jgi:hypothetical protein
MRLGNLISDRVVKYEEAKSFQVEPDPGGIQAERDLSLLQLHAEDQDTFDLLRQRLLAEARPDIAPVLGDLGDALLGMVMELQHNRKLVPLPELDLRILLVAMGKTSDPYDAAEYILDAAEELRASLEAELVTRREWGEDAGPVEAHLAGLKKLAEAVCGAREQVVPTHVPSVSFRQKAAEATPQEIGPAEAASLAALAREDIANAASPRAALGAYEDLFVAWVTGGLMGYEAQRAFALEVFGVVRPNHYDDVAPRSAPFDPALLDAGLAHRLDQVLTEPGGMTVALAKEIVNLAWKHVQAMWNAQPGQVIVAQNYQQLFFQLAANIEDRAVVGALTPSWTG